MAKHRVNPFEIPSLDKKKKLMRNTHEIDPFIMDIDDSSPPRAQIIPKNRFIIMSIICLAGIIILFVRVAALQTIYATSLIKKAENNKSRIIYQEAPRGIIFDRFGTPLTKNTPDIGIFVTIGDMPNKDEDRKLILDRVAGIVQIDARELTERYNIIKQNSKNPYEPILVYPHITQEKAISLSIHQQEMPGIHISPKIFREYPAGLSFSHMLGYTGKINEQQWNKLSTNSLYRIDDDIGKYGIEQFYESELKGRHSEQEVEVDALGHISRVLRTEKAKVGKNITLSIDAELQKKAFEELSKQLKASKATGGSVIIINPQNGEVLTMASLPSFDNNIFSKEIQPSDYQKLLTDPNKPLFNRSISGEYPSGSTIKPLIAAAALQEGNITLNTTINSVGGIQINKWFFPDWKSGGHGVTNVIKAIAESVNTFFYAIGGGYDNIKGLGIDGIRSYAEKFGLNKKTNIDLDGEASGFLPTKDWKESTKNESWYIGDTYHLAIGQGDLLVTPLQIASVTSTIANGGTVYRPHLLIETEKNASAYLIQDHVIDASNVQIVQRGMRETVLSGSAKSLQSLPIAVAAKTGTAQFDQDKFHAWFTCFAPYENPQIAITIILEGGGEGSTFAAPAAKAILDWWANNRYKK